VTRFHIDPLDGRHDVASFDCGQGALNRYLIRFALTNQRANAARTYVGLADEQVIGYYTLAVGEVAYAGASERLIEAWRGTRCR
jgi:hypothetical protein